MNKNHLIIALGFILAGILCIVFKGAIINWLMTIIGVILIIDGILSILANIKEVGIIKIIVGVVLIVMGWVVGVAILYVLSVLFILYGILNLYNLIKAKVTSILLYVMPIMQLVIGVALLFNMGRTVNVIFIIIGICLIIDGIIELVGVLVTKDSTKAE